jgi:hypothetical protein
VIAMQRGLTAAAGIREAQAMGIAEPNASYDIDGWDSALVTHGPDGHYRHRLAESRRRADRLRDVRRCGRHRYIALAGSKSRFAELWSVLH